MSRRARATTAALVLLGAVTGPTVGAGTPAAAQGGAQGPEPVASVPFADERIVESSGLAASALRDDVVWTLNDKGNEPRLFAVDLDTGRTVATLVPEGVDNVDWEDLASGPGTDGRPALWIADTGDGDRDRAEVAIHVVAEPELPAEPPDEPLDLTIPATTLRLAFEDEPRNVEALLVAPDGALVLVTKEPDRAPAVVYAAPPRLHRDELNVLRRVGQVGLADPPPPTRRGGEPAQGRFLATGGSVAPDGRVAALRTYGDVLLWVVEPGAALADALVGRRPTRVLLPPPAGEAVTFLRDGRRLATSAEGVGAPVQVLDLEGHVLLPTFDAPAAPAVAPVDGAAVVGDPPAASPSAPDRSAVASGDVDPEDVELTRVPTGDASTSAPLLVAVLGTTLVAGGILAALLLRRRRSRGEGD